MHRGLFPLAIYSNELTFKGSHLNAGVLIACRNSLVFGDRYYVNMPTGSKYPLKMVEKISTKRLLQVLNTLIFLKYIFSKPFINLKI